MNSLICVISSALVVASGSKINKTTPGHSQDWVAPAVHRGPPSPELPPKPNERFREQSSVHTPDEPTSKLRPEFPSEPNERFRMQSSVHPSDELTSKLREGEVVVFVWESARSFDSFENVVSPSVSDVVGFVIESRTGPYARGSSEVSVDLYDGSSWVSVWSVELDAQAYYSLGGLSVGFAAQSVSRMRLRSLPGLSPTFEGWSDVVVHFGRRSSGSVSVSPTSKLRLGLPSLEPYSLSVQRPENSYSQWKQDLILAPILNQIKNGFFVESGARNGEDHSNTLYYELRGWRGLLIEPGHEYYGIAGKHRKSHSFHGALSLSGNSTRLRFDDARGGVAHVAQQYVGPGFYDHQHEVDAEAEPLDKLLAAIDPHRTTVDFWSLDVEGSEAQVLETTDFNKIKVGLLLVEMNKSPWKNRRISAVLHKNGFIDIGRTTAPRSDSDTSWDPFEDRHSRYHDHALFSEYLDHVFVNPAYFRDLGLPVPEKVPGLY